jgi:hypothetical protein
MHKIITNIVREGFLLCHFLEFCCTGLKKLFFGPKCPS